MRKILVLGANSAIAQATARVFAESGSCLFLVSRNAERLLAVAEDLKVRGCSRIGYRAMDLNETDRHQDLITEATQYLGGLNLVLIAHGELGDQRKAEQEFSVALECLQTNFLSQVSLLTLLANQFESQRSGTLAVISSVAGDRGRQSNYIYGTAKGAMSIFLSGLRNRLYRSNVQVLTIKPGFVDTPMTRDFKKGILWASPEIVAQGIVRAVEKKKDVAYLPFFWGWIMWVIQSIPEKLFKKMTL